MDEQKRDDRTVADGTGTEYLVDVLQKLGNHLSQRFSVHKRDRRTQEQQWLRDLHQFLGKYDPEVEKDLAPSRSRAYPKLTRTKIMVIVARLMNLLFPQSDKSWEIRNSKVPQLSQDELNEAYADWVDENPEQEVTEEELDKLVRAFAAKAARHLETHIEDQLQDAMGSATETDNSDFVTLCRKIILTSAIFGVGILKGPMTLSRTVHKMSIVPGAGPTVETIDAFRPYFEAVDVWRYYPDMQARTFSDMEGEFEDHIYTRSQLEALGRRDDYIKEHIDNFIQSNPEGNYTAEDYEQSLDQLGGGTRATNRGTRFRVQEFWGNVDKEFVKESGIEIPEEAEDYDTFRITAWLAGRHIVKLALNPLPPSTNVYHKFLFDDSVPGLMGGSMCQIMRDSQMAVSSASRMLIDNASVTCGPNLEIDLSKMLAGQDLKSIGPFRNYYTDNKGNPAGHRAINSISMDSHMPELMNVMNQFLQFADMETFVGGYGDVENTPGEALRTSAGASMVLGNAALPFRDIVRSFDRFTVSVLNALVHWNWLFNDDIRHRGDARPVAKGSTSLIAKEVRAFALDNLRQTMGEEEMLYIDPEKLVKQRLMSRDIPAEDIMASEAEVERRKEQQAQQAEEAQQQARDMFDAQLREIITDAMKNSAQAKKHLDSADATSVDAMMKVLSTISQRSAEGGGDEQQGAGGTALPTER